MLSRLPVTMARIAEIEARLGAVHAAGPQQAPPRTGGFAQALDAARRPSSATASGTGRGPAAFDAIIRDAAQATGVSADLLHAVIRAESDYDPTCRSHAGAMGLMQLMPGTARSLGVGDPWDPAQNVLGGARYLREQLDRFGDVSLALAAYNAGPGAVGRYGGVPPYAETQRYVQRVQQYFQERVSAG